MVTQPGVLFFKKMLHPNPLNLTILGTVIFFILFLKSWS